MLRPSAWRLLLFASGCTFSFWSPVARALSFATRLLSPPSTQRPSADQLRLGVPVGLTLRLTASGGVNEDAAPVSRGRLRLLLLLLGGGLRSAVSPTMVADCAEE